MRQILLNENQKRVVKQKPQIPLLQVNFGLVINKLGAELKIRISVYSDYHSRFSFLTNLCNLSAQEITTAATYLKQVYASDIEESFSFVLEYVYLKQPFVESKLERYEEMSLSQTNSFIGSKHLLELYSNISICIHFLSTPATNCAA